MLSFQCVECGRDGGKGVGVVEGEVGGTGEEWEGKWKRMSDGEEEGEGGGRGLREMKWGGGRE